jgi:hypothetical protein
MVCTCGAVDARLVSSRQQCYDCQQQHAPDRRQRRRRRTDADADLDGSETAALAADERQAVAGQHWLRGNDDARLGARLEQRLHGRRRVVAIALRRKQLVIQNVERQLYNTHKRTHMYMYMYIYREHCVSISVSDIRVRVRVHVHIYDAELIVLVRAS